MKLTYAVVTVSLLAAMAGADAQTTSCRVSLSQFGYLQSGMTYDKIVRILGCDGSEISRSDMAGYTTVMYMWSGQGMLGANMNVMLQNNRMVMKSQFGLAN